MWRRKARSLPGGAKAFIYALAVHVTLLLLLGISLRFSTHTPSEPPRVVQARVMDETPKSAPEPPDTARLQEEARRQAEVKKQQEAERRQQKETERKKRAAETEKAEKKKAAALEKSAPMNVAARRTRRH